MSRDLSLSDLAGGDDSGGGSDSANSGGSGGDGGESFKDLLEFLDDRGMLEPLMFGNNANGGDAQTPNPNPNPDGDGGESTGKELNATNIAAFGRMVKGQFGDVSLSQIINMADANPDRINQAIAGLDDADDN
jgi:hypothetical protein